MKLRILLVVVALYSSPDVLAQSSTTETLRKKHTDALNLFFYNNTLRMLNQTDDKDFDELIRDIEKMRFLMIRKKETNFGDSDYEKLISDYRAEAFEEIMTSRHGGKNFDIFLKEKDGKTKGMLVLVNDSTNLFILDILGRIALDKVTKLYTTLDESTDVGSRVKQFMGEDDEEEKKENH